MTIGLLFRLFGAFLAAFVFCAAHQQFSPQIFLVMEFHHGTFCFFDGLHLNKSEAFGTLGMAVGNNLDIDDRAHATEEFLEIGFHRIKRQVADVKPGRGDLDAQGWLSGWFPTGTPLTGPLRRRSPGLMGGIAGVPGVPSHLWDGFWLARKK